MTTHITEIKDIYQKITDAIIRSIEEGTDNFVMPWHTRNNTIPVNAHTNKGYRGVNILMLWIAQMNHEYSSNSWATYKQWQELGAQVRRGEKSTPLVLWKIIEKKDGEGEEAKDKKIVLAREYAVFNVAQVDGYGVQVSEGMKHEAKGFFNALSGKVCHGFNRASYNPLRDEIHMPYIDQFLDETAYYSVLGHEYVHWTGPRVDRELSTNPHSDAYANEELIAELGAAFLCGSLGLSNTPRKDHAAYINFWLKHLKEDNRAIFRAASKAQEAVDYLEKIIE